MTSPHGQSNPPSTQDDQAPTAESIEGAAVRSTVSFNPGDHRGEVHLPPDGRFGPYRVVRALGRGGMGVVYEAEDEQLGRRVALKVMAPGLANEVASRERFKREARAMAAVEHDYIVPVYGVGEYHGQPFIAMPLLAGQTLHTRLAAGGPVPVPEAVVIGRQVAEALAAAHAKGLVHRDVKPSNIWLEANPDGSFRRVRLLDFGLTRPVAGAHLTGTGVVVGTPLYMAPEQARGQPVDHRADLFSLGCVLYRMTTGRPPFSGADMAAVLVAVTGYDPPPAAVANPVVPGPLSDLIARLMAKDPAGRPWDAGAVAELLARSPGGAAPRARSAYSVNLGDWPDARVPDMPGVSSAFPPAAAVPDDPPEVQSAAWCLRFPGAAVRVRGRDALRTLDQPRDVRGAGSAVHTIVLPDAAGVTDADLINFAPFPRVRGLWLARSEVTDEGLEYLAGLPLAQTLIVFGLPFGRVTDAGIETLARFPALFNLDLSGTALTDAGLLALVRLTKAGQLKLARLRVCSTRTTPALLRALAGRLPGCQIESDLGTG